MNDSIKNSRSHRSYRNYLLNPQIQTRLGIISIALAAVFVASAYILVRVQFGRLAETIIELTDVPDEVREILGTSLATTYVLLGGLAFLFAVLNILISVLYTHRLVGPTIAFRRHIQSLSAGKYSARTYLRQRDFFVEVADELNKLSQVLEEKSAPLSATKPGENPETQPSEQ